MVISAGGIPSGFRQKWLLPYFNNIQDRSYYALNHQKQCLIKRNERDTTHDEYWKLGTKTATIKEDE